MQTYNKNKTTMPKGRFSCSHDKLVPYDVVLGHWQLHTFTQSHHKVILQSVLQTMCTRKTPSLHTPCITTDRLQEALSYIMTDRWFRLCLSNPPPAQNPPLPMPLNGPLLFHNCLVISMFSHRVLKSVRGRNVRGLCVAAVYRSGFAEDGIGLRTFSKG